MDMEQSGRRQEPIADAQSGLIVYVTVLLLPAGHTRGARMVVLVKCVSVCEISHLFEVTPRWCAEQQREPRLLGIKPLRTDNCNQPLGSLN